MKNYIKKHKQIILFLVLTFIFSIPYSVIDSYLEIFIRIINSGALAFIIAISLTQSGGGFNKNVPIDRNRSLQIITKQFIAILVWGITFLIVNYIDRGTVLTVLNIPVILGVGAMGYGYYIIKKKKETLDESNNEVDVFKFGYLWLVGVLCIPIFLILVLKGY